MKINSVHGLLAIWVASFLMGTARGESSVETAVAAPASPSAFDITNDMGVGWNLGNTLDAFGGETNWGNPKTTKQMIESVKSAGFKTLRLPVTWDDHLSGDDFKIDSAWLDRVEEVINYGLDSGLYVIINVHHTKGWIAPSAANEVRATDQLTKIWKQVSERLKTYDSKLIFETMNEPRVEEDWWGKQEYFDVVNRMNAKALQTIRSSGQNNANRLVMMPSYVAGGHTHQLESVRMPNDRMIALSVHAYWPFDFAMEMEKTPSFTNTKNLDDLFAYLNTKFISQGIAVVMGEWASSDKNNLSDRVKHATYYVASAQKYRIPTIWWDNGNFKPNTTDAMGLLNRKENRWSHPEIVQALMEGEKQAPSSANAMDDK